MDKEIEKIKIMIFPPDTSKTARQIIAYVLIWNIGYFIAGNHMPQGYSIIVKIAVFIVAMLSYINDQQKMVSISDKSISLEPINIGKPKIEQLSIVYVILAIIYNPIFIFITSKQTWAIMNVLTLIYFLYRSISFRKNKEIEATKVEKKESN